jgi:hypothetical protein
LLIARSFVEGSRQGGKALNASFGGEVPAPVAMPTYFASIAALDANAVGLSPTNATD